MKNRTLVFKLLVVLSPLPIALAALFVVPYLVPGGDANLQTQGTVLGLGPSGVGSGPTVILYSYNVAKVKRANGQPSFTREQTATAAELGRYRVGMPVTVEYSSVSPGLSRLQGFGSGSVYFQERRRDAAQTMKSVWPVVVIFGLLVGGKGLWERKTRI